MSEPRGWFDYGCLYDRIVEEAPPRSVLVEVGVYEGLSLRHLGLAAKKADKGLKVYGVDWGRSQPHIGVGPYLQTTLNTLLDAGLADDVGIIILPSWKAARLFLDRSVFMAFIDADHDYPCARADIEAWLPRIQPGGVIAGHDYNAPDWPGVKQAANEVFGPCQSPAVPSCWEWRVK